MTDTLFTTPYGEIELLRHPARNNETLRAWDAADELLLNHLDQQHILTSDVPVAARILVINDSFGALSLALAKAGYHVTNRHDSFVAQMSCQRNGEANRLEPSLISYQTSLDALDDCYDVVLIKIPKTLAYLDDLLSRLGPHIKSDSQIIAAGMVKQIHNSTLDLFTRYIGETKTSLAKKKARLIFPTITKAPVPELANESTKQPVSWSVPEYDLTLVNFANTFAREKLDIGARLFLEHIPDNSKRNYSHIVDLGCGNGVIGMRARQLHPDSHITFVDESYMAVESAKQGYQANFASLDNATFIANDSLTGFTNDNVSADLILCNPPFHQQNAISDHIAWRMFTQAKELLCQGGELRIVGNRHLNYHTKLKRIFGNMKNIAGNKKFVVLSSIKR